MFESVRQIIESRLFSESAFRSYTSVQGDTLASIAAITGVSSADFLSLTAGSDSFRTRPLITFADNPTGANNSTRVTDFASGVLIPSNTGITTLFLVNTQNTATLFNVFSGGGFAIVSASSDTLSLEDKVADWASTINAESSLGITAVASGTSLEIIPKDNTVNISSSSLNISVNDFSATIVDSFEANSVFILDNNATSFPIFLEGRDFVQPDTGLRNWAVLFINDSAVVGREFGNTTKGLRSSGSVRLKLYAPRNNGTKLLRSMADELNAVLSYTAGDTGTSAGGTLFMKSGALTRVSDDDDGSLSYNLDYIYDYYTS